MDLHRASKQSEWQRVPSKQRNAWQRIARSTNGLATPGNVVSVVGAALVAIGLTYVYQEELVPGLLFLGVGRLADVADGMVAARTRTKSPLGEAVDATIDKLSMLAALIVLVLASIVPLWAIGLVALFNSTTVALSVAAKYIKRPLHPSMTGKFATAFQWVAFMLYVAAELCKDSGYQALGDTAAAVGGLMIIISLLTGAVAIKGYAFAVFTHRK